MQIDNILLIMPGSDTSGNLHRLLITVIYGGWNFLVGLAVHSGLLFVCIAVFMHGPQGPGPRAANFQGRHIKKKSRLK